MGRIKLRASFWALATVLLLCTGATTDAVKVSSLRHSSSVSTALVAAGSTGVGRQGTVDLVALLRRNRVSSLAQVSSACDDANLGSKSKCKSIGKVFLYYKNLAKKDPSVEIRSKAAWNSDFAAVIRRDVALYNVLRGSNPPVTDEASAAAACRIVHNHDNSYDYTHCLVGIAAVLARNHANNDRGRMELAQVWERLYHYALAGRLIQLHAAIGVECEMAGVVVYKHNPARESDKNRYIAYDVHLSETQTTTLGIPLFMVAIDHRNNYNIVEAKTGPLTPAMLALGENPISKSRALFGVLKTAVQTSWQQHGQNSRVDTVATAFNNAAPSDEWHVNFPPQGRYWNDPFSRIRIWRTEQDHDSGLTEPIETVAPGDLVLEYKQSGMQVQVNVGLPPSAFLDTAGDLQALFGVGKHWGRFDAVRTAVQRHLQAIRYDQTTLWASMNDNEKGIFVLSTWMSYCTAVYNLHKSGSKRVRELKLGNWGTRTTYALKRGKRANAQFSRIQQGVSKNEYRLMTKTYVSALSTATFDARVRASSSEAAKRLYKAIRKAAGGDKAPRRALVALIVEEFNLGLPGQDKMPSTHANELQGRNGAGLPALKHAYFEKKSNGEPVPEVRRREIEVAAYTKNLEWLKAELESKLSVCGTNVWDRTFGGGVCQSPVGKPLPAYEILVRGRWQPAGVFETRSGNPLHDAFGLVYRMRPQEADAAIQSLATLTGN